MTPMSNPCYDAIAQAVAYLNRKTDTWSAGQRRAVFTSPTFQAFDDAISVAALAGDVAATQEACRAQWTYVLTQRVTPEKTEAA